MQKTLSALALSLALLLPQHTTAATRMDFSNEYNHSSIHAEGDGYFIDKVKELTSNEVTIALHTGGHSATSRQIISMPWQTMPFSWQIPWPALWRE